MCPDGEEQPHAVEISEEIMEDYANSEEYEDGDKNQDLSGVIPGLGRSWVNDIRADESLGLIAACRINSSLLEPYRNAIAEVEYDLVDQLKVRESDEDRPRAIDDIAAVMAAYVEARKAYDARTEAMRFRRVELDANPKLCRVAEKAAKHTKRKVSKTATGETDSYAEVRKIVDQIIAEAERMASFEQSIEGLLKTEAGGMVRNMLEEAALAILSRRKNTVAPPYRPTVMGAPTTSRRPQAAKSTNALSKGAFVRHGASLVQRNQGKGRVSLSRAVEFAQCYGLATDAAQELAKMSADVSGLLWGNGNGSLLYEASLSVAATLSRSAEPSAAITPPPNAVLAIGALELFCAWRPKERVVSTSTKGFAMLVTGMYGVLFPNLEARDWDPRSTIVDISNAWQAGRSAILFDGRDPSRSERYALMRRVHLDQDEAEAKKCSDFGELAEDKEFGMGRVRPRFAGK